MIFAFSGCDANLLQKHHSQSFSIAPRRVMSLNACTDQLLVALGDKSQIASLSFYAKDVQTSPILEIARQYPTNNMTPEEIISINPDLILSSPYERDATIQVIDSLNIKSSKFDVPSNIETAKALVTQAGIALGQEARATVLNKAIDEASSQSNLPQIRALIYYQGGFSAGANTLIDEIMNRAGLENTAPSYGVGNWGKVDIESVVANPPEIIILPQNDGGGRTSRAINPNILEHAKDGTKIFYLPNNLGFCGGQNIVELSNRLKQIRAEYGK